MSGRHHHHRHSSNSSNQLPSPNELYPVVHDLSEVEYGDDSCGCGETFGNFQLRDLVFPQVPSPSIWNTLCPNTNINGAVDNGEQQPQSNPISHSITQQQDTNSNTTTMVSRMRTPVKRNGLQKKDSPTADGMDDLPSPSSNHPLQEEPSPVTPSSRISNTSSSSKRSARRSFDESKKDDTTAADDKTMPPEPTLSPPRKKKGSHLRRRSRQLMNMILSRSNSMGSLSNKDLSTTEASTESGNHPDASIPLNRAFSDSYILTRKVFTCQSSEIWECLHRESGIRYCVKTFEYPTAADYHEVDMLHFLTRGQQPDYAPLSQLVEVFEEPCHAQEETKLYVVMELATGGNLLSKVVQDGPLDEQVAKQMTRSILQACQFLHSRHLVHADIQPENILVRGGDALLADFGSTVDLAMHDPFGSRTFSKYSSPEVLHAAEPYSEPADMWSVGCLVYYMLTGASPFDDPSSKRKTMTKISRAEYSFPSFHFGHVSRAAKQFIANLIAVDQSVRMTAAEALDHPWLRVEPLDDHSSHQSSSSSFFVLRKPQQHAADRGCHHRRDSSLGSQSVVRSSQAATTTTIQQSQSMSPSRKSSKKHHRRLSSLTKGLTKLFSPKADQQPLSFPTPSDLFAASTLSSTDHEDDPALRSTSRIIMMDSSKSTPNHRRRLTK
ncbi:MAP kinase-activated protein kinase 2 (Fragment) [Seminavis robusta]|uniref:MAP kinase-activated protein kinase 2 n=1 Tax=Seminavis robusta TaxID=568900 RepID=A0A9N8E9F9_9STRA